MLANARAGEIICLPEGAYHIVSTLLDTTQGSQGDNNTTNSVVTADLRVPAGKLIEATLRHRAATMTLKLVNTPGGEALANTSFSVLTPGGDVIRELIGAFPSLVLAEGEYVAIARREGKDLSDDLQSAVDAGSRRRDSHAMTDDKKKRTAWPRVRLSKNMVERVRRPYLKVAELKSMDSDATKRAPHQLDELWPVRVFTEATKLPAGSEVLRKQPARVRLES